MKPDIKALANGLIEEGRAACESLGQVKGWSLNSVQGLIKRAPVVIKLVETAGKAHGLVGAEKKELAIVLLLLLVPRPWWIPEAVLRVALGALIDAMVGAFNDKFKK